MKISKHWLNEWLGYSLDTDVVAEQMTQLGLEVDNLTPAAQAFSGVVVAEILACENHPDADKLQVCQVNKGDEIVQIVCGAPNARAGLKTALSQIGAVLPNDFKIKKSKLRGVDSFGMLCSEVELGISQEGSGIIELSSDAPVGVDLRDYLGLDDDIIEIDLTPNRADCFSMRGVARDLAVLNKTELKEPEINVVPVQTNGEVPIQIQAPEGCARYISRVIKGVDAKVETPVWIKERLRRSGVKSINPVVDVTNYVMIELGQPMHAFDLSHIEGDIVVRMAKEGEKLILLDGSEAILDPGFLVIADQKQLLAVAGVMGGLLSGVQKTTSDIMLESAYFDPATIIGKSRKLGVHSDSAMRFERGVDIAIQAQAMERATQLIIEICGGQVAPSVVVDEVSALSVRKEVVLSVDKLKRVLGFDLPESQVTAIFEGLGFQPQFVDQQWFVRAPSWRFDIEIAEDLVEEVVRVIGYDSIPATRLLADDTIYPITETLRTQQSIKIQLADLGYQEVINYAFVPEKQLQQLGADHSVFALANPLTQDMAMMRTQLLGGVLENIKANLARQHNDLAFFEIGKVFAKTEEIVQHDSLIMARCGQAAPEQWAVSSRNVDFYDIKGDVCQLIGHHLQFSSSQLKHYHPGRQAAILSDERVIGHLGQIHPSICKKLKIKQDVYVAEFDMSDIQETLLPQWYSTSKYPAVRRDLSLLVPENITWNDINFAIKESLSEQINLLKSVHLFDVYQGSHLKTGFKSMAMALIFQEKNRTLEDKEVDNLVLKAVSYLNQQLNAELRA